MSEALLSGISILLTSIVGYAFLFRSRNDWSSSIDILSWGISLLTGLKTGSRQDILEKALAEMYVLLSYFQTKTGKQSDASDSLRKAKAMALRFDSMPDYGLNAMRFADHLDQAAAFDIFGAAASDSIASLISLLNDQEFARQWMETEKNEQE